MGGRAFSGGHDTGVSSLSLEEVYGAITWCLSHGEELGEYIKRQDAVWEKERERAEARPGCGIGCDRRGI